MEALPEKARSEAQEKGLTTKSGPGMLPGMEQLAIIKNVRCGVGDRGVAWLQFDAYTSESRAALQVIGWDVAKEVIEAYGVSDVSKLEGKPCYVESDKGMSTFTRAAVI